MLSVPEPSTQLHRQSPTPSPSPGVSPNEESTLLSSWPGANKEHQITSATDELQKQFPIVKLPEPAPARETQQRKVTFRYVWERKRPLLRSALKGIKQNFVRTRTIKQISLPSEKG
jgi:hypothetical protein